MNLGDQSRPRRIIERVSGVWGELDYAQRRMFEIRTALPEAIRTPRDQKDAVQAERREYQVRAWDEFEL
jgi:hypothetical protein